jgi:hypothetical protein
LGVIIKGNDKKGFDETGPGRLKFNSCSPVHHYFESRLDNTSK